ncbi:MAG: ABC transporter substrate-binding protein [Thermoplasmatales archaeon]|nr:ABC transporter substrate-binding protein [Thermoplasmatales archaeon]
MNAKVIAVGVVVLLAVVSIGAILVFVDFGEKDTVFESEIGRLRIFGNVNNDDRLDHKDLLLYDKIIAGEANAEDYPLADANRDGAVDVKDKEMVQKLMAKKEVNKVYYMNGDDVVKSFSYPIKKVVPIDRCTPQIQCIGASGKVTGLTIRDDIRYPDMAAVPLVGKAQQVNMDEISKISVDAVVVMNHPTYLSDEDRLEGAGIDVIRVSYENMANELSWAITLGFMLQCEAKSIDFVSWCDDILSYIAEKTATLGEGNRKTTLMGYSNAVAGKHTSYAEVSYLAGCKNLADFDEKSQRIEIGNEFILQEKYQAEYMIWSRTMNYDLHDANARLDHYTNGTKYVVNTRAYENGKGLVVNGSMQMICRVAYIAGEIYPDLFGGDYGDVIHQQYIDNFCNIEYDVTKGTFLLKKADVTT